MSGIVSGDVGMDPLLYATLTILLSKSEAQYHQIIENMLVSKVRPEILQDKIHAKMIVIGMTLIPV